MAATRSDSQRRAAVESMYRIRAVESPPDERGMRTIWHRGAKGAELVSWIDAQGRVARHEFSLFEDVVLWDREQGLKTGEAQPGDGERPMSVKPSDGVSIDAATDVRDERLGHARGSLSSYSGTDKIIAHFKQVMDDTAASGAVLGGTTEVTRPAVAVVKALNEGKRSEKRGLERQRMAVAVAVAVVLVAFSVWLLFRS